MPNDNDNPQPPQLNAEETTRDYDLEILPAPLRRVIESLPKDDKSKLMQVFVSMTAMHTRTGPIPPPDDFREYEKIRPGTGDDVIEMAETEQQIKADSIKKQLLNELLRIGVAYVATGGVIAAIIVAILHEQTTTAGMMGAVAVAITALRRDGRPKE